MILSDIKSACLRAIELNGDPRVPQPPWFVAADDAEDTTEHRHSGLALVETGRSADWYPARLCEWPTAEAIANNATFSPAAAKALVGVLNAKTIEEAHDAIRNAFDQ